MYYVESAFSGLILSIFERKADAIRFARAWERNTGQECYVVFGNPWA